MSDSQDNDVQRKPIRVIGELSVIGLLVIIIVGGAILIAFASGESFGRGLLIAMGTTLIAGGMIGAVVVVIATRNSRRNR